jgi:hypothetical protein
VKYPILLCAIALAACSERPIAYDPLARARETLGQVANREAVVPPACYTATGGVSNPCWVCHTVGRGRNHLTDLDLQEEYAFSDAALENHWSNLFVDRSAAIAATSDAEILAWIRGDNYAPLRQVLATRADYQGYRPDLDLHRGLAADGFAVDGSGWRSYRYKPFLGAFFPTNGSTGDAMIRLPRAFRVDAAGRESRQVYVENLAILERAIGTPPEKDPRLPATYAGGAADVAVVRFDYPLGTELLHSVRYLDPDAPNLLSRRLKELRYLRKVRSLDEWGVLRAYEREADEKAEGKLPTFSGSPETGVVNSFGWLAQAFIEDEAGRLRVQTEEETLFCMGCHSSVGVSVDQTFSFARKPPGDAGWGWQDLRGMKDVPQAGHALPEVLEYVTRVGGGDELRANDEMLARFVPDGVVNTTELTRASLAGDRDLAWLLTPSRARALALDKAYLALVREQSFVRGRDALLRPAVRVHRKVDNGDTELGKAGRLHGDGVLWLDWPSGAVPTQWSADTVNVR